jgi:actin-related protein
MNVERYRVPEALFQPQAILGHDTAGLAETIQFVLSAFDQDTQRRLTKNIFLTGGTAALPNLTSRLITELTALRPSGEQINISMASDLAHDAWIGAAQLAMTREIPWITRSWYEEHGGEFLHQPAWFTNPF